MHPLELLEMRIDMVADLAEGAEMLGERIEKMSGGGKAKGDSVTRNADGSSTHKISSFGGLADFLKDAKGGRPNV